MGERIKALLLGFSNKWAKMGIKKAPVFPEPVSAWAMRSLPLINIGMALCWIAVGSVNWISSRARSSNRGRPKSLKFVIRILLFSLKEAIFFRELGNRNLSLAEVLWRYRAYYARCQSVFSPPTGSIDRRGRQSPLKSRPKNLNLLVIVPTLHL